MTPARLLRIGLRLSLVAGVAFGAYSAVKETIRVTEAKASAERVWSSLLCASKATNESLERAKGAFGTYDISQLGCGRGGGHNGAFFASSEEIASARRNDRSIVEYVHPFRIEVPLNAAIGAALFVNVAAGLMALAWIIGRWVLA